MMKWSNYIIQFEDSNSIMIYKSTNDTLFELTDNMYERINDYLFKGIIKEDLSTQEKKTISELYMNGILVDDDLDETAIYKKSYYESIENEKKGTVYFTPSYECNLRCTYCIMGENVASSSYITRMDRELTEKAAKYIYKSAIKNKIETLTIILYGGEPCLSQQNNLELIRNLKKLNNEEKVEIKYTLITNGYKLTENMAQELSNAGVNSIQITLDGPDYIHDKRRKGLHGERTFDAILKNLNENMVYFRNWVIRVNVDNENVDTICELMDQLADAGINKKCILHMNLVDPSDFSKASGYNDYTIHRFKELYEYGYEKGFQIAPWRRYCSVPDKLYISIDPFGNVYKCPNCMGEDEHCKASIKKSDYWEYAPQKLSEKCLACKYVGVCNGGCDVMRNTSIIGNDYCFSRENYYMAKYYFAAKYHRFNKIERG